jgi:hypothetical protein
MALNETRNIIQATFSDLQKLLQDHVICTPPKQLCLLVVLTAGQVNPSVVWVLTAKMCVRASKLVENPDLVTLHGTNPDQYSSKSGIGQK